MRGWMVSRLCLQRWGRGLMKVRRVLFVAVLVTAFLLLRTLGVIQPTPQCSTPYGVDDTATCVYGDYAYHRGVQI